ncbi:arrestin domain-containing protein 17-like [Amphiura filiformis]|uniref:arrestin domain-containing protein 17-like n=1 Tax=Amphiura filiformis TaxID=82378 RepID=UPI003B21C87B
MDRSEQNKHQNRVLRQKECKLHQFEVIFDSDKQYKAGEWVTGLVKVGVSEAPLKNIEGIALHYEGSAMTEWIEQEFNPRNLSGPGENYKTTRHVKYFARETYFKEKIFIVEKDNRHNGQEYRLSLNIGKHVLPFKFQIPAILLPQSYECKYGYIRYKVFASIVRKRENDLTTQERLFTVLGSGTNVKANTKQGRTLRLPSTKVKETPEVCCWPWRTSVPIDASFQVDKRGCVPGETVFVSGSVGYFSRRTKPSVKISLQQITIARAKRDGKGGEHDKYILKVLVEHTVEESDGHAEVTFDRIPLTISPFCPPARVHAQDGCCIMDIVYCVKLEADVKGLGCFIHPIIIGSAFSSEKIPLDLAIVAPASNNSYRHEGLQSCGDMAWPVNVPFRT